MTLREFVKENRKKIIKMKLNDCINHERNFVYLCKDGELKVGRNDLYGYQDQASFGGFKANEEAANNDLNYIISMSEANNELDKIINI